MLLLLRLRLIRRPFAFLFGGDFALRVVFGRVWGGCVCGEGCVFAFAGWASWRRRWLGVLRLPFWGVGRPFGGWLGVYSFEGVWGGERCAGGDG